MQFLWKYIDDLVGKGLELNQIFHLVFYASARFVPVALPIAMLLASVMVFGKLGENSELVAMKSSGISLIKMFKPFSFLVLIIAIGSYLFSNYVMPIANLKNGSMIYDIQKKKPALNIKPGIFYKDIEGFSIKVGEKKDDNKTLKDILIYDHRSGDGNNKVVIAKSGIMQLTKDEKYLEIILYDGHSYIEPQDRKSKKRKTHRTTHFKENLIRFDLSSFQMGSSSENLYKNHYAMLNNKQLDAAIDSLELKLLEKKNLFIENIKSNYHYSIESFEEKKEIENRYQSLVSKQKQFNLSMNRLKTLRSITKNNKDELEYRKTILAKHKIEWHRKITLAFACIILFFIGSSLGSIIKKGGFGMPVLISVLFFVFYHVLSIIGEKSIKNLSMDPVQGMWMANMIFLPIAILLVYKASRDSSIFNFLSFLRKFSKKQQT